MCCLVVVRSRCLKLSHVPLIDDVFDCLVVLELSSVAVVGWWCLVVR